MSAVAAASIYVHVRLLQCKLVVCSVATRSNVQMNEMKERVIITWEIKNRSLLFRALKRNNNNKNSHTELYEG